MNIGQFAIALWAEAAPKAAQPGLLETLLGSGSGMIIMFAFLGVMFWLVIIKPEKKKQTHHRQMLEALKPNDRIKTVGGIFGTVVQVPKESNEVVVRIDEATNTKIRITRSAVSDVLAQENAGPAVDG